MTDDEPSVTTYTFKPYCSNCCHCTTTQHPCKCVCRCSRLADQQRLEDLKKQLRPLPQKTWPKPKRRHR